MTITWRGGGNFTLKTKTASIELGDSSAKIDDLAIAEPGEYEKLGVSLELLDGTLLITAEELRLLHLDKRKDTLSDHELERLEGIDILFTPVGGGEVLDAKSAVEVINQIEPRVVIPMHTDDPAAFAKGEGETEVVEQFKVIKTALPDDERKIIVLKKRS